MPAACSVCTIVLELRDLLAASAARGVLVVRREEADRVVAPVVAQAALDQVRVVHELVHRQQLDRGDAERRAGARSPPGARGRRRCRAARGGTSGWRVGEALARAPRRSPSRAAAMRGGRSSPQSKRGSMTTTRLGHGRRAVGRRSRAPSDRRSGTGSSAWSQRTSPSIALRVRVEQQLGGIAALAALRGPTGRARGSRSAGRARRRAGSRATPRRCARAGRRASRRRPRRTGRARRVGDSLGTEKLVPIPSNVAPNGYGCPGQTFTGASGARCVPREGCALATARSSRRAQRALSTSVASDLHR